MAAPLENFAWPPEIESWIKSRVREHRKGTTMPNDTHSTKLADALAELIACKDLKDSLNGQTSAGRQGYDYLAKCKEFARREPLAWAAAREALATYHAGDGTRAVPEGWKLVPVEPTRQMLGALWDEALDVCMLSHEDNASRGSAILARAYRAMLAASPSPSTEPAQAQEGGFDRTASHCEGRYVAEEPRHVDGSILDGTNHTTSGTIGQP